MAIAVKAVIGTVRFSYTYVFSPYKDKDTEKEQYKATLLIDKKDTKLVEQVKKAIAEAYNNAVTERWGGKKPKDGYWHNPLQDGDEPDQNGNDRGDSYKGHYFINAKSNQQPGIVDKHYSPIVSSEEFYSGCYGYASVAFSGFINSGKMGVSCFLNNLMKTKDGEPLGGARSDAASDFAGVPLDDDDEM